MKHFSRIATLFLVSLIIACQPKNPIDSSNDTLSKYISSRGPAHISIKDEYMIRFKDNVTEEKQAMGKDYIKIVPSTDFDFHWIGDHELIIKPNKDFLYNRPYSIIINTKKLFGVDDKDLVIGFNTHKLDIHCSLGDVIHSFDGEREQSKIIGQIEASDYIDKQSLINAFKVNQSGNDDLSVDWEGNDEDRYFQFSITGINRSDKDSKLNIEYDLRALDEYAKFSETVHIDALQDFEFSKITQEKYNSSYFTLVFSKALDPAQDISGLISAKDVEFDFKSEIEDNLINIYPESNLNENFQITISEYIKDYTGKNLGQNITEAINLVLDKPEVKLLGSGVISPMSDEVIFPFQAKNLDAVDLEIFKIYDNNVLQFLQYNRLDNTYGQREVGKIIFQDSIPLNRKRANQFEAFYLDLKNMVQLDPGAIYQVRLAYRQHYALTKCETSKSYRLEKDLTKSIISNHRYYEGYKWEHRNDPCYPAFYNRDRFISRNLIGSNIAIIAKMNKLNQLNIKLIDYLNASEISGAEVSVYNFQQQLLASSTTQSGSTEFVLTEKPDFVIAQNNGQYAYLKLQDYDALKMSDFDVSGRSSKGGTDGYIYTERGVWRPGDTIFLSFILESPELVISPDYPIKLHVKDSRGTKRYSETSSNHSGGLYVFKIPTDDTDPTGNWKATVAVGDKKFYKTLKVETVKPNRLKIELAQEHTKEIDMSNGTYDFQFSSKWLHGAPATNLEAKVEAQFVKSSLKFKEHKDFRFTDYSSRLDSRVFIAYNAKLDQDGNASFNIKRPRANNISAKIKLNLKLRVFEESANASEDHVSILINPFKYYAGISLPQTDWYSQSYGLGSKQKFKFISVDKEGKQSANRKLSVGIYRNSEYWWYRQNGRNRYSYTNGKHVGAYKEELVTTSNTGLGEISFDCKDAGFYTIRVCDQETEHCASSRFYVRNYYDDTELSYENRTEISKIFLSTDKAEYETGETANITIPSYEGAKILVSVEKQNSILYQEWIDGKDKETVYKLRCTGEMAPNVYINANIIQAHGQEDNSLPLRMYGVLPVKVYDKDTKLKPSIKMADVIKPLEDYQIEISEENGKAMHYTLAVVDEGLLDLTNYKTPDPFKHFYAKQSLLLKSWDNFDMILNGYGKEMSRVLSIGGDGEGEATNSPKKANRFKPVVKFLGPFSLAAGKKAMHNLTMDNYVGSVKVMCVARHLSSFGNADKVVPVRKPLMILATAPRVLAPEESFNLAVNVFAMEEKVRDVKVSVKVGDELIISDQETKSLSFDRIGDELVKFNLAIKDLIGIGNIEVIAESGSERMTQEIEIDIRNPNPYVTDVVDKLIGPNLEWLSDYELLGVTGTNEAILELSTFPAIDFDRRLKYLLRYPYGCLEQTTSAAFPQLYMENVVKLTDRQRKQMKYNVEKAIRRLGKYKMSDGSLSYWPGERYRDSWAFIYAVHFLLEAKNSGYYVPQSLINDAINALKKTARSFDVNALWAERPKDHYWRNENSFKQTHYTLQSYRLYVLSLGNEALFPAMNLLSAQKGINRSAVSFLSGAYHKAGKSDVAKKLITQNEDKGWFNNYYAYIYGSQLRNKAVVCMILYEINEKEQAAKLAVDIAISLGSRSWYSTQSTAFGLMAVSKFLGDSKRDPLNFTIDMGSGSEQTVQTEKAVFHYKLSDDELNNQKIMVKNLNENNLFARLILSGQPAKTENQSYEKGLSMSVRYTDENGQSIDPASIVQGTDFNAIVTIKNKSTQSYIRNLALSQNLPGGWEIINTRMDKFSDNKDYKITYQDFRDDRVYTFFNLYGKPLEIKLKLNATYPGEYYLPDLFCEAMYDNDIQARIAGQKVIVVPRIN